MSLGDRCGGSFLASDAAKMINGVDLLVDGGYTMR
jgi:hypothetical protein